MSVKKTKRKLSNSRLSKSVGGTGGTIQARYMLIAVVILAIMVSFPLFIVWKQVYITNSSKSMERLSNRIAVMEKEKTRLTLMVEQLSSRKRIEPIAREKYGLEYPNSKAIVVLGSCDSTNNILTNWKLLAMLKKSLVKG